MKKYQRYLRDKIAPHVGHVIQYKMWNGEFALVVQAKFLRMVERPDLFGAEIFVETNTSPFPIKIYCDQIVKCECQPGWVA